MNDRTEHSITRREFVRTTTAAMAAGALLAPRGSAGAPRANMATLRVGLVGCGGRGTGAATQALSADDNVRLTALGDAFADRAESCLQNLRGTGEEITEKLAVSDSDVHVGFDAYKKVIDSGVDVVILTTPPCFRPAHLEYAVQRGVHVFCEKPVAVDAPGVRSILASAAEAKRRNLALVSGFCWRYSTADRAAFKMIHDGAIGDLRAVYTTYNTGPLGTHPRRAGWTDMEWQLRNWHHFTWLSGDHIVEQACHSIDKIAWAFNGVLPERATAVGGRIAREGPETGNVYDHFSVTYDFPGGAKAFHMCRQIPNCANSNTDDLLGTKGVCAVNSWDKRAGHVIRGETNWRYSGDVEPVGKMYQLEHDELFASIRGGEPINDGVWMAHSTMMAIMGRMAAYTGQTITWEQALNSQENLVPDEFTWGAVPVPPVAIPGRTEFS